MTPNTYRVDVMEVDGVFEIGIVCGTFEMVVAMVKGFHEEWSNADQTEPPEWHMSERSLV